jgi:hypothetical protein
VNESIFSVNNAPKTDSVKGVSDCLWSRAWQLILDPTYDEKGQTQIPLLAMPNMNVNWPND